MIKILLLIALILAIYGISEYKSEIKETGEGDKQVVASSDSAGISASTGSLDIGSEIDVQQQSDTSKIEEADNRAEALNRFFARFGSPWKGQGSEFVDIADRYGLDYRLLPVVGCVESSCGQVCNQNCFGWNHGSVQCGTDLDDAACVAEGIATLPYYQRYRETGALADFAIGYNRPHWEDYLFKLEWFYKRID